MTKFILDHGSIEGTRWLATLDDFTRGYVTALFFTDTGTSDDAESDLEHATVAELAPETRGRIISDCARFKCETVNGRATMREYRGVDDERQGHLFHYTRNGHGSGFWEYDGLHVAALTETAKGFGQVDLYRGDDGLLYLA